MLLGAIAFTVLVAAGGCLFFLGALRALRETRKESLGPPPAFSPGGHEAVEVRHPDAQASSDAGVGQLAPPDRLANRPCVHLAALGGLRGGDEAITRALGGLEAEEQRG
jgi:hypothetical protein